MRRSRSIRNSPWHIATEGSPGRRKESGTRPSQKYDETIELNPKDAWSINARGWVWSQKKDYDKAIKDFDEAIKLDPKNAVAFYNRGLCRQSRGLIGGDAWKDFDEAIRLDPNYAPPYRQRGFWRSIFGKLDKAIQDYDVVIRLNPKDASAFVGRGGCWEAKKDYDKAIRDYDEAIRLDPKDGSAFGHRARTRGKMKQWAEKRSPIIPRRSASIPRAMEPPRPQPDLSSLSGRRRRRDGLKNGGKKYSRAMELWKKNGSKGIQMYLDVVAAAYAEAGDYQEAVRWQKKALEDFLYMQTRSKEGRERLKLYQARMPYRIE